LWVRERMICGPRGVWLTSSQVGPNALMRLEPLPGHHLVTGQDGLRPALGEQHRGPLRGDRLDHPVDDLPFLLGEIAVEVLALRLADALQDDLADVLGGDPLGEVRRRDVHPQGLPHPDVRTDPSRLLQRDLHARIPDLLDHGFLGEDPNLAVLQVDLHLDGLGARRFRHAAEHRGQRALEHLHHHLAGEVPLRCDLVDGKQQLALGHPLVLPDHPAGNRLGPTRLINNTGAHPAPLVALASFDQTAIPF
jgi:hypothetical protein